MVGSVDGEGGECKEGREWKFGKQVEINLKQKQKKKLKKQYLK